ncbi:NlpC/P60 family protein [Planobispora rosea]|uniref:NlpC/P60 family protein n=1 Tax=Planobispora rosea TaxID=35762 RepID=UPI00083A7D8F|nr:NlpC/P60 family protein [Planobispora rosea]
MPGVLRNLRVVLGIDFNESGLKRADRALAQIDKKLTVIGRRAAIGGGLAAAAGGATALTAALVPASGAIAALPALMATTKAATATLKVGLIGMGDAMSAVAEGDTAKLDEALTKLSPATRQVVRETDRLKGAWDSLQQSVQDRLFLGLAQEMEPVAANLLPEVHRGMLLVAAGANTATKEALAFARTPMARGATNKVFASSSRIMGQLAGATRPALELITRLTVASLPLAERMASWATNGIKAGSAFLTSERGAAALERTVDRAGDTLGQLGRITGNIGRGMVGTFGAMEDSGDGVLDTIERMTERWAAWSRSVEGQQEAAEFFRVLREVAADVGEVLPLVLGPLGALADLVAGLPDPLRGAVTQMIAFGVVLGPLVGKLGALTSSGLHAAAAVGRMRESVAAAGGPMGALGTAAGRTRTAVGAAAGMLAGPWGLALAAGIGALALFATRNDEAERRVEDLTDALMKNRGVLDENSAASIRSRLETEGILAAAQKLKLNLADVSEAALGNRAAMDRVNAGLTTAKDRARALDEQWGGGIAAAQDYSHHALKVRSALDGTNAELKEARERYGRLTAATPATTSAAEKVEESFYDVGTSATGASNKIGTLNSRLARFHSLTADADTAAMAFEDQIDGLSKAIAKNEFAFKRRNGVLDFTNKRTRESNRLLIDAIKWAVDHAEKLRLEGRGADVANAALRRHIDRLRDVMAKSGMSRREIDRLVRRYVTMPGQINAATARIKDKTTRILIKADGRVIGYKIPGQQEARATGGILPGYTPGKDVHHFVSPTAGRLALSGGEAVMRPEWTRAVGAAYVDKMNAAARRGGVAAVAKAMGIAGDPGGVAPGFAGGGIITKGSVTGMGRVNAMVNFTNKLYSRLAAQVASSVAKQLEQAIGGPGRRAVAAARRQIGVPYSWGGGSLTGPSYGFAQGAGIRGFDCSSLVRYGWYQATRKAMPRTTYGQLPWMRRVSKPQPGALGFPHSGHVWMYSDRPGKIIEAPFTGARVREVPARGARKIGMPPWKFDDGGVLPPGTTPVYNGTRRPEYVFTQRQLQQVGGPTTVNINVNVPPTADAAAVGKAVYESLREYKRKSFGSRSMGL